jgi:histidinol-phosphate/aromatic aminotransferase/cobyric acid decarboxylase-like protein
LTGIDISNDAAALRSVLEAHDRVGYELDKGDGRIFLSGWNGNHPFVSDMLGDLSERFLSASDRLTEYSHMDEDPDLAERLSELHSTYGEGMIESSRFVPGAGSSAFLASLLQYARRLGFHEMCYLPPVYYNAVYWMQELGFRIVRVAATAPLSADVELTLPARRTCLWLTDPLWFAGSPLASSYIDQVASWQQASGSTVIVDGTFAYMDWGGPQPARAAQLDPDRTFRLVCPTKALALHGFRFAYAIVPQAEATTFIEFHGRLHGASSLIDRMFAHRAVDVLQSSLPARTLWPYVSDRYVRLAATDVIGRHVPPTSGYFMFGEVQRANEKAVALDSACYEAASHEGYVRVNLIDDAVVEYLFSISGRGGRGHRRQNPRTPLQLTVTAPVGGLGLPTSSPHVADAMQRGTSVEY